jgi:UDP-galactopyranose mutase
MPINLATICAFYKKFLTPEEAKEIIQIQADLYSNTEPANFEEKLSLLLVHRYMNHYLKDIPSSSGKKIPKNFHPKLLVGYR